MSAVISPEGFIDIVNILNFSSRKVFLKFVRKLLTKIFWHLGHNLVLQQFAVTLNFGSVDSTEASGEVFFSRRVKVVEQTSRLLEYRSKSRMGNQIYVCKLLLLKHLSVRPIYNK